MFEYKDIYNDLKSLGINEGDTLFLRISYKSIGEIKGGPKVFLDALLDILGDEGTIILTAFPKKYISQLRFFYRRKVYSDMNRPKPTTGVMAKVASQFTNAKVSKKIDAPFIVIGKYANYLTQNHTYERDVYWLLEEAIYRFNCRCLRIGGEPYIGTTHMSLNNIFIKHNYYQKRIRNGLYIKDNDKIKWINTSNVVFCTNGFKNYIPKILPKIIIKDGTLGNGYAIITDMKKSIEEEMRLLEIDINNILCEDINCLLCRTTYKFSDTKKLIFLVNQIKRVFSAEYKSAIKNIYSYIIHLILGRRVY